MRSNILNNGGDSTKINLGNGTGFSVLEVIEAARKVTGKAIEMKIEPRRAGDPSHLIADAKKAAEILELETAIRRHRNRLSKRLGIGN